MYSLLDVRELKPLVLIARKLYDRKVRCACIWSDFILPSRCALQDDMYAAALSSTRPIPLAATGARYWCVSVRKYYCTKCITNKRSGPCSACRPIDTKSWAVDSPCNHPLVSYHTFGAGRQEEKPLFCASNKGTTCVRLSQHSGQCNDPD
jgi:hypothetical protein